MSPQVRSLLLGGVLPVVAYTFVEEYFGTLWGLVAGMVLGVGEIAAEWIQKRKVDPITWIGNGLILVMGTISLVTKEGIWFKLQPAILEAATAALCLGSVVAGKPFLVMMARKQGLFSRFPDALHAPLEKIFGGFTFRLGLFFLAHALLATWAAVHWSTRAWAILKGVGFTATLVGYMVLETLVMRKRIAGLVPAGEESEPVPPPPGPQAGSSK